MKKDSPTRGARIQKASRHRREQQKEELRQAILEAASALFVEQGYHGFSMRQLAERIGYSAATLYLYFRDKDDLLFTVVDEGYTRFARQLAEAAVSSNEPWERLNRLSQAYITFGLRNPVYYQLMFMWPVDFLTQTPTASQHPPLHPFPLLPHPLKYAIDTR